MSAFEYMSVGLSFVVGLGVVHVLSTLLKVFHARRQCSLDWLPLTWTIFVLLSQLHYWWLIYQLAEQSTWTVATFAYLFLLAVVLFLSGGLMLPDEPASYEKGLRHYFQEDGRWGVLVFTAYFFIGIFGNVNRFGYAAFDPLHLILMPMVVTGVVFTRMTTRRGRVVTTAVYGLLLAFSFYISTPTTY